jgi:hypothetical protein
VDDETVLNVHVGFLQGWVADGWCALQSYKLEDLDFPDQAYEVGPPPMMGTSPRGRSIVPPARERLRGDTTGQLLVDFELQTGPTIGPVYQVPSPPLCTVL